MSEGQMMRGVESISFPPKNSEQIELCARELQDKFKNTAEIGYTEVFNILSQNLNSNKLAEKILEGVSASSQVLTETEREVILRKLEEASEKEAA